ncbi:unnamed protein product, partial [Musa acuminata subsp. burmannicoides]
MIGFNGEKSSACCNLRWCFCMVCTLLSPAQFILLSLFEDSFHLCRKGNVMNYQDRNISFHFGTAADD